MVSLDWMRGRYRPQIRLVRLKIELGRLRERDRLRGYTLGGRLRRQRPKVPCRLNRPRHITKLGCRLLLLRCWCWRGCNPGPGLLYHDVTHSEVGCWLLSCE